MCVCQIVFPLTILSCICQFSCVCLLTLYLIFVHSMYHNIVLDMAYYIVWIVYKVRVVCGTVYGDMHLKDLLGSIVRVGYHIPVPDFYLVLHGLRCRKSTIKD